MTDGVPGDGAFDKTDCMPTSNLQPSPPVSMRPAMSTCVNIGDYQKRLIKWQKERIEQLERAQNGLQEQVALWASNALPSDANHLSKLIEEAEELQAAPGDPMEMADVLLALMLHAEENGVDLLAAGHEKLAIVQERHYGPADDRGITRHTES